MWSTDSIVTIPPIHLSSFEVRCECVICYRLYYQFDIIVTKTRQRQGFDNLCVQVDFYSTQSRQVPNNTWKHVNVVWLQYLQKLYFITCIRTLNLYWVLHSLEIIQKNGFDENAKYFSHFICMVLNWHTLWSVCKIFWK